MKWDNSHGDDIGSGGISVQTHQTQAQQAKTDAVPSSTPPVTQPTSPLPTIEPKSNAEGLAEHAERLEKFRKLDTSMVQMGPPRLRNGTPIQPKLTIGAPGDKYEQEADRVAKQVVTQIHSPKSPNPSSSAQRQDLPERDELMMKPLIQRHNGPKDANPNLEQAINQSKGGGRPLDEKIRGPMEQAFGANFGNVRVHSDTKAHQLNESIQARAFTTGQDLFFRQGAYQPTNRAGQELLAHELTHVVQQNGKSIQPSPQSKSNVAKPSQKNEPTPSKSMDLCWKSQDVLRKRQSTKQSNFSQVKNNVIPYITDQQINQTAFTDGRLQKMEHLSQEASARPQYALVEKRQPQTTVIDSISPNPFPSIQRELANSWNQDEELYKLKDQVHGLQWYYNPETRKFYYLVEGQATDTETAQGNNMSVQDLHTFWVGYALAERDLANWRVEANKDETGLLDSRIPWEGFIDAVGEDPEQENSEVSDNPQEASTILGKITGLFKPAKPNAKSNKWRLGAEGIGHLAGGAIILALTVPAIGSGAGAILGVPAALGGGVQILIGLSKLGRAWLTHKKGKEKNEQTAQKYGEWLNNLIALEGGLSLAFNTFMAIATGGAVVSILGASGGLLKAVRGITLRATDFGNKHPKFVALMTGIEGILTCIGRVLGIVIEGAAQGAAIAKDAVLMTVAAIKESRAGANWRKAKEAAEAQ